MKKYLILLLLVLCTQQNEAQWRKLINEPTFDMWQNPKNHATMIVGGEGRVVYKTYDYGEHWDTLIVGYRGGTARFNNVFINPVDTNIYVIGGLVFGDIRYSSDGGKNWIKALENEAGIALNGKSLEMQPDNPNNMYLGDWNTGVLYKTTNKGLSWDSVSICTRTIKVNKKDTIVGVNFGCLTIRKDSSNIILLGTTSGELYMSNDYGKTWKFRQQLKKPKEDADDCEITRIEFTERDPLVGYGVITYLFGGNVPSGGVHKTTDGGYTWTNIAYPDTSFWAVCTRPNEKGDDDEVFIGGYTENYTEADSFRVVGIGMVRRSTDGGNSWFSYDSNINWTVLHPKDDNIYDIYYVDSINAFICGEKGHIKFSTTGGKSWNWCYPETTENFYSVYFKDPNVGFAVGSNGIIAKTTNFGQKWSKIFISEKEQLNSITTNKNGELFTVGNNGIVYKTTNQGNNWTKVNTGINENFNKIKFYNNFGIIISNNKEIIFSTDDGSLWSKLLTDKISNNEGLLSVDFSLLKNKFYLLSSLNNIYTVDLMGNVEKIKSNIYSKKLNSISILNDKVYLSGDSGVILKSNINFDNIAKNYTPIKMDLYKILALSDSMIVTCGKYRTVLRTFNAGDEWLVNSWGGGPLANMWSMRYFGEKGKEKVYMASEAGFFVLDYPSYVKEMIENKEFPFRIYEQNNENLKITYKIHNFDNSNLILRISDIQGKILKETILDKTSELIDYNVNTEDMIAGTYIFQMIDGKEGYSLIYIK